MKKIYTPTWSLYVTLLICIFPIPAIFIGIYKMWKPKNDKDYLDGQFIFRVCVFVIISFLVADLTVWNSQFYSLF